MRLNLNIAIIYAPGYLHIYMLKLILQMESLLVLVLSVSIVSVVSSETFQHGNVADTHSGK